ncbi:reprolysin-like metallopeptidase [Olleya sp. HaHaR_3_96]|uniref:reprolysin-like metallopeptidase n=1 Tax=Olleya sp. HaHaR_3_96 TaxID=2745560 RepID=UPI001C4E556A|nr:zinc-dependent metalloprotease family protein [Olleya sp. HaHaR_3_96]QXP60985.1 T9SS type A sorting domain-containing protein [Olleya sp. HaHaR_3_96]
MKKLLLNFLGALTMFVCTLSYAQQDYWIKSSESKVVGLEKVRRASFPSDYQIFSLNVDKLKQAIVNAPVRGENLGKSNVFAYFPNTEGELERFSVSEAPIMEPELAAKNPMIKTYKAVGVDDPTATMRFSLTQFGLHTMSLSGNRGSLFIDPYTKTNDFYIVYERSALGQDLQGFECLTDQNVELRSLKNETSDRRADTDDMQLRTYRLAQSCNGEYGAIFAGTGTDAQKKQNIQAQMAITINRVNEVYERDLAITLVFINRNDELIYYDAATDPWNAEFNTKTQETISTTLNDESLYDIGHNFNTSGGGSAGCLGCVCLDGAAPYGGNQKGRGYTGRPNPTGDPFDIDYVAHEMGHQFDGYHTMNTCSRSGNGTTEVEPASGSSIMGYAGICTTNVQSNSDAHFNYVNIRDISENIQPGGTSDCGATMALTNQPPVADAGDNYSIPPSTAFVLRGSATDPDGLASLTYNWAPNDASQAPTDGAPQPNWTTGPMYRSINPTASPDRFMPSYSDVVAGNLTPTWEVTPAVARTMNFSFIVRDNASGFANGIGQTDADLMAVNVVGDQPFTIVSPPAWGSGSNQTLTWNVGISNGAIINCQTVNIKFSTDGGLTFPTTLASGVANDGSETIVVPTIADTNNARIMVEAADNIFYALSDVFPISNTPSFVLNNTSGSQIICTADAIDYTIEMFTVNGFSETTNFTAAFSPALPVTAVFSPASLNADGSTVVSVSGLAGATAGDYVITVTGVSASQTKAVDLPLTIIDGICASVATTTYDTGTTLVQFGDIDNASAKPAGYSDYRVSPTATQVTDVLTGSTYPITVNQNTDGAYTCVTSVWIDWNQNCIFESDETYDLGSANGVADGPASNSGLSVMVPTDAVLGATTMRVTTKYSSASGSCENGHDAEVEDYTVNVTESLSTSDFENISNFNVYPNPNNGEFVIAIKNNNLNSNLNVIVYDVRGRRVYTNSFANSNDFNQTIKLDNVESGLYLLKVTDGRSTITKKLLVR